MDSELDEFDSEFCFLKDGIVPLERDKVRKMKNKPSYRKNIKRYYEIERELQKLESETRHD